MHLHLWPTNIPELSALPARLRKSAWRSLQPQLLRHWESWLSLFACAVLAATGGFLGFRFGAGFVSGALGAAIGGAIGGLTLNQALIYVARRYHGAALRSPVVA